MSNFTHFLKKRPTISACICVVGIFFLFILMLGASTSGWAIDNLSAPAPADDIQPLAPIDTFKPSSLPPRLNSDTASTQIANGGHSQLLLITYGRSGSSFTSALISRSPDVFYTFEPLYVLQKKASALYRLWENVERGRSVEILNAFLSCDFASLSGSDFDNTQLRNSGQEGSAFTSCVQRQDSGTAHVGCFLQMLRTCRNRTVSFVKAIRFRVQWAERVLEQNANLKLLYLVRDPRAVLFSQARVFNNFKWPLEVKKGSEFHCRLLAEDIVVLERLRAKFPDRVKVIRYETGATNPVAYTQELYNFVGLKFTPETLRYVKSLTNSTEKGPGPVSYSLKKHNTTKTMNQWRYLSGYNSVRIVDGICGPHYAKLGYKAVTSQRDLESDRSLVGTPTPGQLFEGIFNS